VGGGQQRGVGDAGGGAQLGAAVATVDDQGHEHGVGAVLAHDIDGLHQRGTAGGRVLGDHDLVARQQGAGDPPRDAVVLGLLADAEAAQVTTAGGGDGGHAEGDRIGTHREPSDGGGVGG